MKTNFAFIAMTIVFANCTLTDPKDTRVGFDFNAKTYMLPQKVSEVLKSDSLRYYPYQGFKKIENDWTILLRLENYPIWMGTDNTDSAYYLDKNVIGISFAKPIRESLENILKSLEDKYQKKFIVMKPADLRLLKANDKLSIVYSKNKSNNFISFYVDLPESEIEEFTENIW